MDFTHLNEHYHKKRHKKLINSVRIREIPLLKRGALQTLYIPPGWLSMGVIAYYLKLSHRIFWQLSTIYTLNIPTFNLYQFDYNKACMANLKY